jgi:hypothetical protein
MMMTMMESGGRERKIIIIRKMLTSARGRERKIIIIKKMLTSCNLPGTS